MCHLKLWTPKNISINEWLGASGVRKNIFGIERCCLKLDRQCMVTNSSDLPFFLKTKQKPPNFVLCQIASFVDKAMVFGPIRCGESAFWSSKVFYPFKKFFTPFFQPVSQTLTLLFFETCKRGVNFLPPKTNQKSILSRGNWRNLWLSTPVRCVIWNSGPQRISASKSDWELLGFEKTYLASTGVAWK